VTYFWNFNEILRKTMSGLNARSPNIAWMYNQEWCSVAYHFRSLWPSFHISFHIKGKSCLGPILNTVLCMITKLVMVSFIITTRNGAVSQTIFRSLWPTFHISFHIKEKSCLDHILNTVLCIITKLVMVSFIIVQFI